MNNKDRINAKYKNCDEWMLNPLSNRKCQTIQTKKLKSNHSCGLEILSRYILYKLLGETYN